MSWNPMSWFPGTCGFSGSGITGVSRIFPMASSEISHFWISPWCSNAWDMGVTSRVVITTTATKVARSSDPSRANASPKARTPAKTAWVITSRAPKGGPWSLSSR